MMHWLMRLTVKKKMAVLRYCAGCNQSRMSRVTPALNREQKISQILLSTETGLPDPKT